MKFHIPIVDEPEEEEEEDSRVTSEEEIIESLSSHVEQLSSSEHEKLTVYRCIIPDFSHIAARIFAMEKRRSNSLIYNTKHRDVERNLILLNKPFRPKYVKHKKYRSENASEVSEEMNEERYYREKEDEEENYPEYILDSTMPYTDLKLKPREKEQPKVKNPSFIKPSPSLKE